MRSRLAAVVAVLVCSSRPLWAAPAKVVTVDCAAGKTTITRALDDMATELVVEFSGTCAEDVLIARDRVTLRGIGVSPKIVGATGVPSADRKPGVTVRGASNVRLTGFTVTDSDYRGIELRGSDAVRIDGVTVTGNRNGLTLLEQSAAVVSNSTVDNNFGNGIGVWDNSSLVFEGSVSASSNGLAGILASGSSLSVSTAGANVQANGNRYGFFMQAASNALMTSAGPTTVSAIQNLTTGLSLTGNSLWYGKVGIAQSEYGIDVEDVSSINSASSTISSCPTAVYVGSGSNATFYSVVLSSNQIGFWIDDSSATIYGSALTGSSVSDVSLEFGARLSASGTTATSVSCDGTSLVRGGISCPSSVASRLEASSSSEARPKPALPQLTIEDDGTEATPDGRSSRDGAR